MPRLLRIAPLAVLSAIVLTTAVRRAGAARQQPASPAGDLVPAARIFVAGDFGGLSWATLRTNALPYKLVVAALALAAERRGEGRVRPADVPGLFRRYGFLSDAAIRNGSAAGADGGVASGGRGVLGLVRRSVRAPVPGVRVDAVNIGCATCHAGTGYGADGRPTGQVWLGLPNSSINLEAYTFEVYQAMRAGLAEPDTLLARVDALFPGTSRMERLTLRAAVLPMARRRLTVLARELARATPFSNGGAGRTNGVAALKGQLGLVSAHRLAPGEVGFTSIPDLAARGLRSSLLYDGAYAPLGSARAARTSGGPAYADSLAGVVAFFTVPTMGLAPDRAEAAIPAVAQVMRWLDASYRPPAFPGRIDTAAAHEGARLYAARCASCHGVYADGPAPRRLVSFPNRLVAAESIGTDRARARAVDAALVRALGRTAYVRHVEARATGGYVAPILSGVWATAPYLHNGSVPTLWQLLTPEARPVRFTVGGHRLDFTTVGLAGAVGADGVFRDTSTYAPWSRPEIVDTRSPGMGNGGHTREVEGLTTHDKRQLLEYLKGL